MSYSPERLANQVLQTCRPLASSKQLELRVESAAAPAEVVGDQDRVMQVLVNLVTNALNYTERGTVTIQLAGTDDGVEFRVCDTGPGIDPALQPKVWDAYQRGTTQGSGLGLGLAVVKSLAHAMGGTVGLESTPGVGSEFWVRLPGQGPRPQRVRWS